MADPFQSGYASSLAMIDGLGADISRRMAGSAMSRGDYSGASNALYRLGDISGGNDILDRQSQQQATTDASAARKKAQQLDTTLKVTRALKDVRAQGGDILAAYDSFAPALQQLGVEQAELGQIRGQLQSDAGFLDKIEQLAGEQKQALEFRSLGNDVIALDKGTGQEVSRYEAYRPPTVVGGVALKPGTNEVLFDSRDPKTLSVSTGETILELPRGGQPAGAPDVARMEQLALGSLPGSQVTSGARTPEHNAEVGGVKNSYHLSGQARDLSIPQGMSAADAAQAVRSQLGPDWQVINEGDHVHIEPARRSGGPRVIAQGAARADDTPSGYRYGSDGNLQFIPGGPADPATKTSAGLKPVPPKIQQGYVENNATIKQIDDAIELVRQNPGAFGLKNIAGDRVMQRADPKGVGPRAAVANIGSKLIHDRSGAAVTASETPRLKPFVPAADDRADNIITKLQGLRQQVLNETTGIELAYGEDSGYRPLGGGSTAPQSRPAAGTPPAAANPPATVQAPLWKSATTQQRQYWTANPPPAGEPRGSLKNPLRMNPLDPNGSAANARSGQYLLTPDGQVIRKP